MIVRCYLFIYLPFLFLSLLQNSVQQSKMPSAVLELNEKFVEVKDSGHWIIEFYAPWCGHCKRLAPLWEQLGHQLAETHVRVGKLDCTRFPKAATAIGINGYPTIKYFRDGKEILYEGDRTKEAILDFVAKASGPEVRKVKDATEFQTDAYNPHHRHGFFVLQVVNEDMEHELVKKFYDTAKEMFTKTFFFSVSPEDVPQNLSLPSSPAIISVKEDGYTLYDSDDEFHTLTEWVNAERWPTVTQVTFGNFYDITLCCNKLLVLAVLDIVERSKKGSPVQLFYNILKKVAVSRKRELGGSLQFGWLDGNELANNIVLATMKVPSVLVFNGTSYQYFLPEDSAENMTEESLFLWLETVIAGGSTASGGRGFMQKIRRMIYEVYSALHGMFSTQPLLSCCLFGLPLGILSVICYTICTTDASVDQEEIYPESEESEDDSDHEKRE